ncbi:MAG: hypothetical protein IJT79_05870 [Ruminococcus sp.]|nr:hypothetical protein [Ruminococcus sp.]
MNDYNDIINLPAHDIKKHHLSLYDRAAQFAPFAALTGFGAVINETSRLTDSKPELSEDTVRLLNERIHLLRESIKLKPEIELLYFVPDKKKSGGSIQKFQGKLRRIDEFNRELIFVNKTQIAIDDVIFIQGDFFKDIAPDTAV